MKPGTFIHVLTKEALRAHRQDPQACSDGRKSSPGSIGDNRERSCAHACKAENIVARESFQTTSTTELIKQKVFMDEEGEIHP